MVHKLKSENFLFWFKSCEAELVNGPIQGLTHCLILWEFLDER